MFSHLCLRLATVLAVLLATLGLSSCGGGGGSTGGARHRLLVFNPGTGIVHTRDLNQRDAVLVDDTRDLGPNLDGMAASSEGTTALVWESDTAFLIAVSYANTYDLRVVATDIGMVPFFIGGASMPGDGRVALLHDDTRSEVQILGLGGLPSLDYGVVVMLDEPFVELVQSPTSAFALLFPETLVDTLWFIDYSSPMNPLVTFPLPLTDFLQSFEFSPTRKELAVGVETGTGQVLSFVFDQASPAGEVVADTITLADPETRNLAYAPTDEMVLVATADGVLHAVDISNPFRIFEDPSRTLATGVAGDDILLAFSPDGRFLLVSAAGVLEIYEASDLTAPELLRRFVLPSPLVELGFSSEHALPFTFDLTAYLILDSSTIHLVDLREALPRLTAGTTFPTYVARVLIDDPAGGRFAGLDNSGAIPYFSITLRAMDGPALLGTFNPDPGIGGGFGEVTFLVR
jgi:hypothetical protein